jgi:hypothetical protein
LRLVSAAVSIPFLFVAAALASPNRSINGEAVGGGLV